MTQQFHPYRPTLGPRDSDLKIFLYTIYSSGDTGTIRVPNTQSGNKVTLMHRGALLYQEEGPDTCNAWTETVRIMHSKTNHKEKANTL